MSRTAYAICFFSLVLGTTNLLFADDHSNELDAILRRAAGHVDRPEGDAAPSDKDKALARAKEFIKSTSEVAKETWKKVEEAASDFLVPALGKGNTSQKAEFFVNLLEDGSVISKLREDQALNTDDALAKEIAKRLKIDAVKFSDSKSLESRQLKALTEALAKVVRPVKTPPLVPAPPPAKAEPLLPVPPAAKPADKTPTLIPGTIQDGPGLGEVEEPPWRRRRPDPNTGGGNNVNNGGNNNAGVNPTPTIDPSLLKAINDLKNRKNDRPPENNDSGLSKDQPPPPPEKQQQEQQQPPPQVSPGSPGQHAQVPPLQPAQIPDGTLKIADMSQMFAAQAQAMGNTGLSELAPKIGPRDPVEVSWKAVEGLVNDGRAFAQTILQGLALQFQTALARQGGGGGMPPGTALQGVASQIGGLGSSGAPQSPLGNTLPGR